MKPTEPLPPKHYYIKALEEYKGKKLSITKLSVLYGSYFERLSNYLHELDAQLTSWRSLVFRLWAWPLYGLACLASLVIMIVFIGLMILITLIKGPPKEDV